jgi:hypothetical protein
MFTCELSQCPLCEAPLTPLAYVTGRKTLQLLDEVVRVAYRPKVCTERGCRGAGQPLGSAAWQALAPKYSTYGYDVLAQLGWERQYGRAPFALIHDRLVRRVQISDSMVRHLYHQKYLPLLACHERLQWPALRALAERQGLWLSLDGLLPEGGEAQLWVIRELHEGWTLRSGWLSNQDEATFVAFLQPLAALGLSVQVVLSDKQRGLLPAVAHVFPQAQHAWCQLHYLQNAAAPVAALDEQMKIALRQGVRAEVGELIRQKNPEKPVELTITGMVPSPLPPTAQPAATAMEAAAQERERIVQDVLQRVRYLLTLKGRPPFRLAGQEMFARLQEVERCVSQLLQHQPEPRLAALRSGLHQALQAVRPTYAELDVAAQWLAQIAAALEPDGHAAPRTSAAVRADWEAVLADIAQASQTSATLTTLGAQIAKVSASYAPGLFVAYDLPDFPRTNNGCESEFRLLRGRLLSTTGQAGTVKRLLLREGAWELIRGPASLAETCAALAQVDSRALREEEQRVKHHRAGFRLHTRSAKQSQAQLKELVRRWKALPAKGVPK